jgi:hypothetical protein
MLQQRWKSWSRCIWHGAFALKEDYKSIYEVKDRQVQGQQIKRMDTIYKQCLPELKNKLKGTEG